LTSYHYFVYSYLKLLFNKLFVIKRRKMDKLFKAVLIALIFSVVFTGCKKNQAPEIPSTPVGPSSGSINIEYTFTSSAEELNEDSVVIRFDWSDGDTSDWSAWQASEDSISMSHSWTDNGTYSVKAQAKNKKDVTSDWSAGHPIDISAGWFNTFGGSNLDDGRSVKQTSDGGYIIAGCTQSYGGGWTDVYLIRTNPGGDTLWTKTFGGSAEEWGEAVRPTSDSGYIVVGECMLGSNRQIWLIKTNSTGIRTWDKYFGYDDCQEDGNAVQQTSDGGYIIVGTTQEDGHDQVFLIKTGADGGTAWYKLKGYSDSNERGYSVQQTTDGGYIITGTTNHFDDDGDVWLVKVGADGGTAWSQHFGDASSDYGNSVRQTTDGGYVIVGGTGPTDNQNIYLIKTDANGNQQWSRIYGGSAMEWGKTVEQTSDGGYMIAGTTASYGAGQADIYLIKTNATGDTLWTKTFGGSAYDWGNSVQQTSDGGYIITGATESYGVGSYDVYLIKTDANGNTE
jgi:hypothetical protein